MMGAGRAGSRGPFSPTQPPDAALIETPSYTSHGTPQVMLCHTVCSPLQPKKEYLFLGWSEMFRVLGFLVQGYLVRGNEHARHAVQLGHRLAGRRASSKAFHF